MAIELEPAAANSATPDSGAGRASFRFAMRPRISAKDRMVFTEQLALLLDGGVSLHHALKLVSEQTQNPSFREVLERITDDVFEGKSLSQALDAHPDVFSKVYVNLVGASEKGGYLKTVLAKILGMEEKKEELREILVSAMAYPSFLLVFALSVVIFVLVAVFPKFADLFANIRNQLPVTTLFLMGLSDFLLQHWLPTLFGVIAAITAAIYGLRQPVVAARIDRLKLTLPGARGLFSQLYLLQFMQVLSLSLSNGVTILETLMASREVVKNRFFQEFLIRLEIRVTEGSGIAAAFREFPFVPSMVEQMIRAGEETGNLPAVAQRLAEFYERDLVKRMKILSKLAEPAMLVVMGGVVGVIVSSLILPIFKLSKSLG